MDGGIVHVIIGWAFADPLIRAEHGSICLRRHLKHGQIIFFLDNLLVDGNRNQGGAINRVGESVE